MQLAGERVALGMGGVAARKGAVEVAGPDGVELVGELIGPAAALDDGEGAAGVADDVGVGGEVKARMHRAGVAGLPQGVSDVGGPDEAVAVPLGLAVADPHAVDHAAAEEPVVGGRVGIDDRVGAIAEIPTVEVVGDGPDDREIGDGALLAYRAIVAFQVTIRGHRTSQASFHSIAMHHR